MPAEHDGLNIVNKNKQSDTETVIHTTQTPQLERQNTNLDVQSDLCPGQTSSTPVAGNLKEEPSANSVSQYETDSQIEPGTEDEIEIGILDIDFDAKPDFKDTTEDKIISQEMQLTSKEVKAPSKDDASIPKLNQIRSKDGQSGPTERKDIEEEIVSKEEQSTPDEEIASDNEQITSMEKEITTKKQQKSSNEMEITTKEKAHSKGMLLIKAKLFFCVHNYCGFCKAEFFFYTFKYFLLLLKLPK